MLWIQPERKPFGFLFHNKPNRCSARYLTWSCGFSGNSYLSRKKTAKRSAVMCNMSDFLQEKVGSSVCQQRFTPQNKRCQTNPHHCPAKKYKSAPHMLATIIPARSCLEPFYARLFLVRLWSYQKEPLQNLAEETASLPDLAKATIMHGNMRVIPNVVGTMSIISFHSEATMRTYGRLFLGTQCNWATSARTQDTPTWNRNIFFWD